MSRASLRNSFSLQMITCAALLCACDESKPEQHSEEFVVTVTNLTPSESLFHTGRFDTPDTELLAGPLGPGQSYSFDVTVWPGAQLQVITMLVESNDAFVAFRPGGIALWAPNGDLLDGNRSADLVLYDAGTEVNEPLGAGAAQPPRQTQPNQGLAENGYVTVISEGSAGATTGPDGVVFPAISDFIELHVVHIDGPRFRVVIGNVSSNKLLGGPPNGNHKDAKPALLSPGVFTVHESGREFFDIGEPASPQLERLVEDGDPGPFAEQLRFMQGVTSPLSGVVWAVHGGEVGLYGVGSQVSAGLEQLIENGRPQLLIEQLALADEFRQVGLAPADGSVIESRKTVEFRFRAAPGDHLSFVSGYLAANDKFIAATELGVALFDDQGEPRTGNLDWALGLFDAGTEVDEPPGLGANQFERQSLNGGGPDENGIVREVHGEWNGWEYPAADRIVSVRLDVISTTKPDGP